MSFNVLVTGASGNLGNLIVHELLNLKATIPGLNVIAGSRTTDKLDALKAKGAELRTVDMTDKKGLVKAFSGVQRIILISNEGFSQDHIQIQADTIDAAVEAKVEHILYTSFVSPHPSLPLYTKHFYTEAHLGKIPNSVGFTILRNHLYQEVLLSSLPHAVSTGSWAVATGDKFTRSYVSRADLALAAAIAATNITQNTERRFFDLSGPEQHTSSQAAEVLSDVVGKTVKISEISFETLVSIYNNFMPPEVSVPIATLDKHTALGYDSSTSGDLEQLIGRKPKTLRQFFTEQKNFLLGSK
jgi:NAD(P)H dehydrogenase (quinone)